MIEKNKINNTDVFFQLKWTSICVGKHIIFYACMLYGSIEGMLVMLFERAERQTSV